MATKMQHSAAWELVRRQHGVITRAQLLSLGYTTAAIKHRLAEGRLHRVYPGVYAVGRPELSRLGTFMAAVLSVGEGAALSHESAAALWLILPPRWGPVHVSTPRSRRGHEGVALHRRRGLKTTWRHGIPVSTPVETVIDIAPRLERGELEAAIKEADVLGLCSPARIRAALDSFPGRRGVGVLRTILDHHTFVMTSSETERRFVPIARRAGLAKPLSQVYVNGHRVDFFFADLGLVVEADGGTYHRTPMQQTADRRRDQEHLAAGMTPLRFTHAQIAFEARHVEAVLRTVAARLSPRAAGAAA